MGVRCLLDINSFDSGISLNTISKKLEKHNANNIGKWLINCTHLLRSSEFDPSNQAREAFLVSFNENPEYQYLHTEKTIFESNSDNLELFLKETAIFVSRQSFELTGNIYTLGDFVVKLGTITISGMKRNIIEVEYLANSLCSLQVGQIFLSFLSDTLELKADISAITNTFNFSQYKNLPILFNFQHSVAQLVTQIKK